MKQLPDNWLLEVGQVRQIREEYSFHSGDKLIVEKFEEELRGEGDGAWLMKTAIVVFPDGKREKFDLLWLRGCSDILND